MGGPGREDETLADLSIQQLISREIDDYEENSAMAAQGKDTFDEPPPSADPAGKFPVPDEVWIGRFAEVADHLGGERTWEVLMGTLIAMGARAHRNIHVRYHGMLYGMMYGLVVAGTGSGKSICTETCQGLLPTWYVVRGAVQSGPALAPILAKIERDGKGKIKSIDPRQACLIVPEWSKIGRNMKLINSSLSDDLNVLADGPLIWNCSRSEANKTGGGDLVIQKPCLCICATTVAGMFREVVTIQDLRNGTVNRYLILPGRVTEWRLYDPDRAQMDFERLSLIGDSIDMAHSLGGDVDSVWDLYEPDAKEAYLAWGTPLFERNQETREPGIMNNPDQSAESEAFKRLHAQAHRIGAIYCWTDRDTRIRLKHFEAARAIVDTSRAFLEDLLSQPVEVPAPPHIAHELSGRDIVRARLERMWETQTENINIRAAFHGVKRHMKMKTFRANVQDLQEEGFLVIRGLEVERC